MPKNSSQDGAREPVEVEITPTLGGVLRSSDGKVVIQFPGGAVAEKATAKITPKTGRTPLGQSDWHTYAFEVQLRGASGGVIHSLGRAVSVEVTYDDDDVRGLNRASLALHTYDEAQKRWIKLSSAVDPINRRITATTTHFSDFNILGDPYFIKPGMINSFETDLFSGSASFSYPLEVPPGTNGLQPKLSLSYSSGSVDEMKSENSRASWTGMGWHLNIGSISYDPTNSDSTNKKFNISINGVSDELIQGSDGYWHTKKESFLRINRVDVSNDWHWLNDCYWEVWTKDGTYYRFGHKKDTDRFNSTDNGDGTQVGIDGSRHCYVDWGNDGQGDWWYVHTYFRWDLDLVQDTHGNTMTISYRGVSGLFHVSQSGSYSERFDRSSYPYEIKYSGNDATGPRRTIRFVLGGRHDTPSNVMSYETHKLERIDMFIGLSAETLVRKYVLQYYDPNRTGHEEDEHKQLRLWKVIQYGADGANALPPYEFSYQNKQIHYDYNGVTDGGWNRGRLITADNGHGGTVSFTYTENTTPDAWSRQVVASRTVADGWGAPSTYTYQYQNGRDYKAPSPNQTWQFRGFNVVTATDPAGNVSHSRFHQGLVGDTPGALQPQYFEDSTAYGDADGLEGKAFEQDQHQGSGAKLSRKIMLYQAVSLPGDSTSIRFIRLNQSEEYLDSRRKWSTYQYDSYGNVVETYEYSDASANWYRRTRRIFDVNTTNWIVDRMTQEIIYDANDVWQSSTYYAYDRHDLRQPPLSKGELWWVRKNLREVGNRFYTFDTLYGYDAYGNRTSETIYEGEGYYDWNNGIQNNTYGQGAARVSLFTYDTNYHTYKLSESTPEISAGFRLTTSYQYDYRFGSVTQVTDPNGALTVHSYDALGRRIATFLPGDDAAQPGAATITYRYLIAKGSPLRVQIGRRKDGGGGSFGRRAYQWRIYDGLGRIVQTQTDFDRSSQQIRAVDINELRTACVNHGRPPSFNAVTAGVDRILASHFAGLRTSVQNLWNDISMGPLPSWSSNVSPGGPSMGTSPTPIFGADLVDLRGWLNLYESNRSITLTNFANSGGTVIVVNKHYNNRGLLDKETVPHFRTLKVPGQFDSADWNPASYVGTSYLYDGLRRETKRTFPGGAYVETSYSGYTTSVFDERRHKKVYTNDAFGRLIKVEEFSGTSPYTLVGTTNYAYDVGNRLTTVTDNANNQTIIEYDRVGRKLKMHDPDMCGSNYWWQYVYKPQGPMEMQTDSKGQVLTFEYDAIQRLRFIKNLGTTLAEFQYDQTSGSFSSYFGKGRRTTMMFPSSSNRVESYYDKRGRVVKSNVVLNSTAYDVLSTYDDLDRVSTITYPNQEVVTYRYGDHGLPVTLESSVKGRIVSNASYNALGRPFDVTLGNGLVTSYRYWGIDHGSTNYGMPWSIATGGHQGLTYGYDAKGNVSSLVDTRFEPDETISFTYDHLDRLTYAGSSYFSETNSYNSIGNFGSKGGVSYTYPTAGNPRPHAPTHVGGNLYQYDANGNLTSAESRAYEYDIQNRLTRITEGANEVSSFTYDGDGALRTMVKSGQTIRYVTPDYRVNVNTGEVTVYYRFGGKAVAYRNNSGLRYVLSDHLSSTHGEVGENQAEMGQRRYLPFGSDRSVSGASDIADEERYTSQRRIDAGNGNARREIYHYGARAYLPGIGIFTQPDTIVPDYKNPQALNRFAYVLNNPMRYTDPTGHFTGDPLMDAYIMESEPATNLIYVDPMIDYEIMMSEFSSSSGYEELEVLSPTWGQSYSPEISYTSVIDPKPDPIVGTEAFGFTMSGGIVGHGGTASVMVARDESRAALVLSAGAGGMATVISGSASATYQRTNATSVDQLSGWSAQAGGGYGEGLGGSAEVVTGNGYVGVDVNAGFSGGFPPVEFHGFGAHSWVIRIK